MSLRNFLVWVLMTTCLAVVASCAVQRTVREGDRIVEQRMVLKPPYSKPKPDYNE